MRVRESAGETRIDSPDANYTIEGLTPETHPTYCREALVTILKACPSSSGLTLRTDASGGVPEGSYTFWTNLLDAIAKSGRRIEIDLDANGLDPRLIEIASKTGMPVKISPSCWANHMGLPYPPASAPRGSSYGGLFAGHHSYEVFHRIWPGTNRLLLWADPQTTASYSRMGSFCGSAGIEILEPLSFKGCRGSGVTGGRCGYSDASLTSTYDWQKYIHSYRVWGQTLYNPLSDQYVRRRYLAKFLGRQGAEKAAGALSDASRILTMLTTAHRPSLESSYWPELYTNQPIVDTGAARFGTAPPGDPQLFACVEEYVEMLLGGEPSGKISPLEVAQFFDAVAGYAADALQAAAKIVIDPRAPEFRRLAVDVAIQIGLGRFFALKFRSAILYSIYLRTGDHTALENALEHYRKARQAWSQLSEEARVYRSDITFGDDWLLRGHWSDRLAAIDRDIANLATAAARASGIAAEKARITIARALAGKQRSVPCRHARVARFQPGQPLSIELEIQDASRTIAARLRYRQVNQDAEWQSADMERQGNRHIGLIGGDYTRSPYPLQYYFELREEGTAWLYPGLGPKRTSQPYYVIQTG